MLISFGELRKQRLALHISQAQLAKDTGINRNVLSAVETGKLLASVEVTQKLVEYFGDRGVELEDISSRPPTGEAGDSAPRFLDNLLAAPSLDPERAEDLVGELIETRERIAELAELPFSQGFFVSEDRIQREQHELLLRFVQQVSIIREIQGGTLIPPLEEGEEPATHGQWLARELAQLRATQEEPQAA